MKLASRKHVLAAVAFTLSFSTFAEASPRSIRGGISTDRAHANTDATAAHSSRLSESSESSSDLAQGSMRRSRTGFGAESETAAVAENKTHAYQRDGGTVVTLERKSEGRFSDSVKINIEGLVQADRSEFLQAFKEEVQKNVAVRAHITLNATGGNGTRGGGIATEFYITTGMRHPMTVSESSAIFQAADKALRDLLENVTVAVQDQATSAAPSGRRRF